MAEDIKEENNEEVSDTEVTSENESDQKETETENLDTKKKTEEVKDSKEEAQEEEKKKTPNPLVKKILFGVVGFLALTLIIGLLLFIFGFFDPEEEPKDMQKESIQVTQVEERKSFNISDINSKKLNKQLQLLTNENILREEENIRREKEAEEKKIKEAEEKKKEEALALEEEKLSKEKELLEYKKVELEKQKEELELLKNEAIVLRNEMIAVKDEMEKQKEELIIKDEMEKQKEELVQKEIIEKQKEELVEKEKIVEVIPMEKTVPEKTIKDIVTSKKGFVSLINVAKIKGELYKSYLDKVSSIYNDVKLCRDDLNIIEIYYGPFEDEKLRNDIYEKLQVNKIINSYKVELTKEEFDRRCNY